MDTKQKILVCGDVGGHFKHFFNKVEKINKKSGPFDFLLCVGDFFGESNDELQAFKSGNKFVHIPTYILGPTSPNHQQYYDSITDGEICPNLTYLGKRGLYTASSGVKIAYLSGVEGTTSDSTTFDQIDIEAVRNACFAASTSSDFRGVDILMTSQWPMGIQSNADATSSNLISWLSNDIRPRYHFCGMNDQHMEYQPFRTTANDITQLVLSTRFIALASVTNGAKAKSIYALNMTPVDKMKVLDLIQKTTDEVQSPYLALDFGGLKRKGVGEDSKQFFYDMSSYGGDRAKKRGGDHRNSHRDFKRPARFEVDQEKCWFCFASPNVEKHLVISVGDSFYLALAKGPLNETHVLLVSVTHIQSVSLLSKDDFDELVKFKEALRKYFDSLKRTVTFFERNYKSPHLQVNAIAVDNELTWQLKQTVEDKAEEYNLQFEELPEITEATLLPPQGPYFAIELPDKTAMVTRQMKHFPLHFGRDIFCAETLLNCEAKVDWRQCSLDKAEEVELVTKFRDGFKPFDFTL